MNAKFELEIADQNIVVSAFRTPGGTAELFERIAQEARSHVPDVTTKKGRDQIGSLALKISKSKTFIEKCGKELVAEQKAKIKLIDDDRIATVKKFDELRNEILAPRDAWEQAEKDRVEKHKSDIEKIRDFAHPSVLHDMPANRIAEQIRMLDVLEICPLFEEFEQEAKIAKLETLEALRTTFVSREKYEAEQAELERLRIAEQQRIQQEREAQIAREAAEKATRDAEEKARFEAERVQREKAESEQREARLKAEKEAAELRAQQAAETERKRIEAEQFAQAEAARKAEEARKADVEHRRKINREALDAIKCVCPELSEPQVKSLVGAIISGLIPHVSIKY
ncbi:hypothetical protein [Acinetobacter sp. YH12073]|uniref:hypothetical protein n=1 Tax=Acinetobacter sp. YH12073 TaxID=2601069 RepID=UPI0015D16903|nr:hypothetical protein [Acinetobacter sp. YH12073]